MKIIRQIYDQDPDGNYNYAIETENGIFFEEQGFQKDSVVHVKQGQYQYTSPEGKVINLLYTADENGFQPQGSHLPTAPPIPPLILRSLEYQATENPQ